MFQILSGYHWSVQPVRYGPTILHANRNGLYHFSNRFGIDLGLSLVFEFAIKMLTKISFSKWSTLKWTLFSHLWSHLFPAQRRFSYFVTLASWPLTASATWQIQFTNPSGDVFRLICRSILFLSFRMHKSQFVIMALVFLL